MNNQEHPQDRKRIRAKIVDDLADRLIIEFPIAMSDDPDLKKLCERIQGKEVNLIFTYGDAFEELDDNYWLPNSCWTEVDGWKVKCQCGDEHEVTSERLGGTPFFECHCGRRLSIY